MAKMAKQQREEFLADVHVGVVSVAGAEGQPPTSVPTFYAYEPGGAITMFTGTQRRTPQRIERIKEAGVVTLVAQREAMPPAYVTVALNRWPAAMGFAGVMTTSCLVFWE